MSFYQIVSNVMEKCPSTLRILNILQDFLIFNIFFRNVPNDVSLSTTMEPFKIKRFRLLIGDMNYIF